MGAYRRSPARTCDPDDAPVELLGIGAISTIDGPSRRRRRKQPLGFAPPAPPVPAKKSAKRKR